MDAPFRVSPLWQPHFHAGHTPADCDDRCAPRSAVRVCHHFSITDEMARDYIDHPGSRPTPFCPDCRSYLYPYEDGNGAIRLPDEPLGAGVD